MRFMQIYSVRRQYVTRKNNCLKVIIYMYQHSIAIASHTMKKSSKTNWINMNEVSGFLLYSSYFAWKRKIESTLLPHDLTHVQFMLLMKLGFLKFAGNK